MKKILKNLMTQKEITNIFQKFKLIIVSYNFIFFYKKAPNLNIFQKIFQLKMSIEL